MVVKRVVKIPVTPLEFIRLDRRDFSGLGLLRQLPLRFVDRVSERARLGDESQCDRIQLTSRRRDLAEVWLLIGLAASRILRRRWARPSLTKRRRSLMALSFPFVGEAAPSVRLDEFGGAAVEVFAF